MFTQFGVYLADRLFADSRRHSGRVVCALLLAVGQSFAAEPANPSRATNHSSSFATPAQVGQRRVVVPDTSVVIVLNASVNAQGKRVETYAIALDGRNFSEPRVLDSQLALRMGSFDPREEQLPAPTELKAGTESKLALVQFVTPPLESYLLDIKKLSGEPLKYIPGSAYIVRIDADARKALAERGYVRWIGNLDPFLKLDAKVASDSLSEIKGGRSIGLTSYNVMLLSDDAQAKANVAQLSQQLGGRIVTLPTAGSFMTVALKPAQAAKLARSDDVLFMDEATPIGFDGDMPDGSGSGGIGYDMAVIRETTGATFLRETLGFTGQGVRGEIVDNNVRATHLDFQSDPIIFHTSATGGTDHGTPMMGILFGDGVFNSDAMGMLPSGQPIFSDSDVVLNDRQTYTAESVQAPYFASFQSNSWGNTQTPLYTTRSAEMDEMAFNIDIAFLQSMSNVGNQNARPEAWAKNVISNGAILAGNTASRNDDCWCNVGSTGPASDGRIKPDLANIGDFVLAASDASDTSYGNTCCTSAATASNAGVVGLFLQLWHSGAFGNTPGATVFDSRPKTTFIKAMLINTARPWTFTSPSSEINRYRQGWGQPNLQNIVNFRKPVMINETEVVQALETRTWNVTVGSNDSFIKATLVYADPAAAPLASVHRINDLSLRLTAPNGAVYWGNNGLTNGMWSVSGGSSDTLNTVENVLIENPRTGVWQVTVIADEINEDGHVETPELDADFSLVVTLPSTESDVTGLDMNWHTIDGGGVSSLLGGNFEVASTIGQPDAGMLIGGDFRIGGGFWAPLQGPACPGDANGDGNTNGADLSVLLGQFGQSVTPGTGADFNSDGVVNGADLSILLANFGCPI